jgi:hypothetical protein
MSRSFLTGLNLNKNELLNARIQNLQNPPSSPVAGQIYYDTDTNQITLWNGTAWVSLAAGGDVTGQITAAIDALTTDVIEEGSTNLYFTNERAQDAVGTLITNGTQSGITVTYVDADAKLNFSVADQWAGKTTSDLTEGTNLYFTDERAQDAVANAISAGTHSNITITYDDLTNKFTFAAENGVADSTTDNLTEGSTNKYFTDERAQDAVGNALGSGLSYNDTTGAISVDTNTIASKTYVDGLVQGLSVKDSVRAATAAAGTLASDFEPGDTVGGVTLAQGDRILIKNQSTATENGIYVVAASGAPTRAADADPVASELEKGSYVLVTDGTYAATGWIVTGYSEGATTWTQFSAANEYTDGDGIAIAGNVISADIVANSGLKISSNKLDVNLQALGGLGADVLGSGIFVSTGTGLTKDGLTGAVKLDTSNGYGVRKYAAQNTLLEPTSNVVSWVVTHSLSTRDVDVQVYELSGYTQVEVDVVRTNTAAVTLSWVATANVAADSYRVVVVG